jgi:hypothetical protein
MRSRRTRWLSGLGAVVLIGTVGLANYGTGVPQAGAQSTPTNPLTEILAKLDQILAAISGIQEGNHTLRWDANHPSASRFVTAFPGAVLDKNTGLVWEQVPDPAARPWLSAIGYCVNKNVEGTAGWRLPSAVELISVKDPTLPAPFVPASVFSGVQSAGYWSGTTDPDFETDRWGVNFASGLVFSSNRASDHFVWCVRGGMQADAY